MKETNETDKATCKACQGSGRSSSGSRCMPCNGKGKKRKRGK